MPDGRFFKPKPGRFGLVLNSASYELSQGDVIVASGTKSFYLSVPPGKYTILRCNVFCSATATGSGTITAQFFKHRQLENSDATLTAAFDIKGMTALKRTLVPITTTVEQDLILRDESVSGDSIRVDVVASGTVTAQPANLIFVCELGTRE